MEINELQKWNIAQDINSEYDAEALIEQLINIPRPSEVKFISQKIDFQGRKWYSSIPYKIALIDFEGSPAILIGLMINDTILTYYIEDYQYLNEFNMVILELSTYDVYNRQSRKP